MPGATANLPTPWQISVTGQALWLRISLGKQPLDGWRANKLEPDVLLDMISCTKCTCTALTSHLHLSSGLFGESRIFPNECAALPLETFQLKSVNTMRTANFEAQWSEKSG